VLACSSALLADMHVHAYEHNQFCQQLLWHWDQHVCRLEQPCLFLSQTNTLCVAVQDSRDGQARGNILFAPG